MGLPFFVNCSFLIQRAIYFETAPFFMHTINIGSLSTGVGEEILYL